MESTSRSKPSSRRLLLEFESDSASRPVAAPSRIARGGHQVTIDRGDRCSGTFAYISISTGWNGYSSRHLYILYTLQCMHSGYYRGGAGIGFVARGKEGQINSITHAHTPMPPSVNWFRSSLSLPRLLPLSLSLSESLSLSFSTAEIRATLPVEPILQRKNGEGICRRTY